MEFRYGQGLETRLETIWRKEWKPHIKYRSKSLKVIAPVDQQIKLQSFLCCYIKLGARSINIEAHSSSIEKIIEAISSISALLPKGFPGL